jgi:hypothetical protein
MFCIINAWIKKIEHHDLVSIVIGALGHMDIQNFTSYTFQPSNPLNECILKNE